MKNFAPDRLVAAVDATVVAELFAISAGGALAVEVVTPLLDDGGVVVALPYAERAFADSLSSAEQVALVLSDQRMTLRGWEPLVICGRIELETDPHGHRFGEQLLEQELRKHPPSRLLADSLRDRHDHWWFLSRLLCHLVVTDVRQIAPRSEPVTGVLGWTGDVGLDVDTVEITDADGDRVWLRSLSNRVLRGNRGSAVLFRHDYSRPDLERRSQRREFGVFDDGVLHGSDRRGQLLLPEPPGLLERIRRQRELSRACRRELARSRRTR